MICDNTVARASSFERAPDRRLADAIDNSQLRHRLALGIALSSDADHLRIQFPLAAKRDTLGPGSDNAFLAALADQAAFELSDGPQPR